MRALRTALRIRKNLASILKRLLHLVFVSNRSHGNGNSFANSSRTSFCIPLLPFRSSGIQVAQIPEFRCVQKTGNSGIPEFGNSGIAITTCNTTACLVKLHVHCRGKACNSNYFVIWTRGVF